MKSIMTVNSGLVVFVHFLLVLLLCSIHFLKFGKINPYIVIVSLTMPFIGPAYLAATEIYHHVFKTEKSLKKAEKTLKEHSRHVKENIKDVHVDSSSAETVKNYIPVRDALLINSNEVKRSLVIDLLKEEPLDYVEVLKDALNDQDTETSHYAATAITDTVNKFNLLIQDLSVKYDANKSDLKVAIPYANAIRKYLGSGLLSKKNRYTHMNTYALVLEGILKQYDKYQEYFKEKINAEIELGNYVKAKICCDEYNFAHGKKEGPYLMYMKLYYNLKDKANFKAALEQLKKSGIPISNEGLSAIRFWQGGE